MKKDTYKVSFFMLEISPQSPAAISSLIIESALPAEHKAEKANSTRKASVEERSISIYMSTAGTQLDAASEME